MGTVNGIHVPEASDAYRLKIINRAIVLNFAKDLEDQFHARAMKFFGNLKDIKHVPVHWHWASSSSEADSGYLGLAFHILRIGLYRNSNSSARQQLWHLHR